MDQITDALYIGDIEDAANQAWLRDGSPTAVLKLTHGMPAEPYPDTLTVEDVPLIDGPQNDYDDFVRAVEALLSLLEDGHVVFVHCSAGSSRSGAVAAAALAVRRNSNLEAALADIQANRPVVEPHPALREHAERHLEAD
jgi:protein-tyrosine phosphatase